MVHSYDGAVLNFRSFVCWFVAAALFECTEKWSGGTAFHSSKFDQVSC